MTDNKEHLIKEIIDMGKLTDFEEIIRGVIENINQQNFSISARYDSTQSMTRWYPSRHIFLSLIKDPLLILWDLFHEFGHVISGEKMIVSKICGYDRELKAWDNAHRDISKYPFLLRHKENFEKYRNACLGTYEINKYQTGVQQKHAADGE